MSQIGETPRMEQPVSFLSSSFSHKTALPEKKSIFGMSSKPKRPSSYYWIDLPIR